VIKPKQTWREQRLAREENSTDSEGSQVELETGESTGVKVGSGDIVQSSNEAMDMNMVFLVPSDFCMPESEVAEMVVGVRRAVFEKPAKLA
jgi:hypothetical protein